MTLLDRVPLTRMGKLWARMSELGGFSRRVLLLLAVTAFLAGLAEAGLLMVLVQIAFTASGGEPGSLPVLGELELAMGVLFATATGLALARFGLHVWSAHLAARASTDMFVRLRAHVWNAYQEASWPRQSAALGGELREIILGHAKKAGTLTSAVSAFVIAGVNFTALVLASLVVNFVGSLVMVVVAVLLFVLLRPIGKLSRRLGTEQADRNLRYGQEVHEAVGTALEIKVFNTGRAVGERLKERLHLLGESSYRLSFLSGAYALIYQTLAVLLIIGGLGVLYAAGLASSGSMGVVILLLIRSLGYSQGAQSALQKIATIEPALERLQKTIEDFEANAVPRGGEPLSRVERVEFREVSYVYPGGRRALENVSFAVSHGQVVGIAGPSGAGKSTLIQILLRLRAPTAGALLVNGEPAEAFARVDWYGVAAYVPQDCRLVSGTVADNIRWLRPSIDNAAIERAARMAHIHEEVVSWSDGYETQVGEGGSRVSGGQRQRICLARAFAGEPDLIVLDEPTSALDGRSEMLVRQTLAEARGRTTIFVIAHRESTLEVCERVLRLDAGLLLSDSAPLAA